MKALIDNRVIRDINKRNELLGFAAETWEKSFQFYMKECSDDNIIEPLQAIKKACEDLENYLMKTKPAIK